jgi:hypothetical protein
VQLEGLLCWNCGRPTGIQHKVSRHDRCDNCGADLHTCRGCRHFEPGRRYQCRETVESNVLDKEKANFCDFFQMRQVMKTAGGVSTKVETKEDRRKRFDDLFED